MATTTERDLITPETYLTYMKEDFPEVNLLIQSGCMMGLPSETMKALNAGGQLINVPFYNDVDREESTVISDDDSSELITAKITASRDQLTKHRRARGWSAMSLSGMLATGDSNDPIRHGLSRIGAYWRSDMQKTLIATLEGVFAENAANHGSDMIASVYSSTRAADAINNNHRFTQSSFDAARLTMGDHLNDLALLIVHSSVFKTMLDNEAIDYIQQSKLDYDIPRYKKKFKVLVDDTVPVDTSGTTPAYTSYLLGMGCIGYGMCSAKPEDLLERDRNPVSGDGGGKTIFVTRKFYGMHPLGIRWTDNQVAKRSPSNAELRLASNWSRQYERKNIKMAKLITHA